MSARFLVMLGMTAGSIAGGYLPVLFGADIFSFWSIVGSFVGGTLGIWIGYKVWGLLS